MWKVFVVERMGEEREMGARPSREQVIELMRRLHNENPARAIIIRNPQGEQVFP